MSKTDTVEVKKEMVTIQFKLTTSEYTEIQQAKIEEGKARGSNLDYYRELLFRGIQNKPL